MSNKKDNLSYNNMIVLIGLSFILKGIGFVNRIVIAYCYGTSVNTDLYYISTGFIDGIAAIILASFSVGIISLYIKAKERGEGQKFLTNIVVFVESIMFMFMIISTLLSNGLAHLLAPSLSNNDISILANNFKVLSIIFPFIGISSVLSSVLQAEKRFIPVKLMGAITSIVSIIVVCIAVNKWSEASLIISYIAGNVLNAIFVYVCLHKIYSFHINEIQFNKQDYTSLLKLSYPLMLGLAAHELNLMIDKSLATSLFLGAASALSYCSVLYLFLENTVVNSVVTIVYPNMVSLTKDKFDRELGKYTRKTIYLTELILIPMVLILFVFSKEIISLLFMRGKFDQDSLWLTEQALRGYIIGLPFLVIKDVLTRVYYAHDDTKFPMIVNLISVGINISLDFILGKAIGIIGITLATAISIIFTSVVFYLAINKYNKYIRGNISKKIIFYLMFITIFLMSCCQIRDHINAHSIIKLIISGLNMLLIEIAYLKMCDKELFSTIVIFVRKKIRAGKISR